MTIVLDHIEKSILRPDPETCLLFLDVPGSKVVLFQAFFELYEGLATVRTIDIRRSEIMLITTPGLISDVFSVLTAIKDQITWRLIEPPVNFDLTSFLEH